MKTKITIIAAMLLLSINSFSQLIAGGGDHTLILCNTGTVKAFGSNGYGQLGNGTTTDSHTPIQVSLLTNVTAISGGYTHSLAIKNDSTAWAWGYNNYGQLGVGTTIDHHAPTHIFGISGVVSIRGGQSHTLALKSDGTVWAWGYGYYGQLGDNNITDSHSPIQVKDSSGSGYLTGITAIAAGNDHSVALKNDGTVWCWGYGVQGELGDGQNVPRLLPVHVLAPSGSGYLTGIIAIASGVEDDHTLALKNDGTVWTWGYNAQGQLGDGTTMDSNIPVQAIGLTGITEIAVGGELALALKNDGTIWAWGLNYTSTPAQVSGINGVTAIAAGYGQCIALKDDGTVWIWGYNSNGQLGDGTIINEDNPEHLNGICQVSALSITTTNTNVSCHGDSTGSAIANVSGDYPPFTYSWSTTPIQTSDTATNLVAGTYTVTVTDSLYNILIKIITITQPSKLVVTNSGDIATCQGDSINICSYASGGTSPYNYSWSDSVTVSCQTQLIEVPSTYTDTVRDANGCLVVSLPINISIIPGPPVPTITSTGPTTFCEGEYIILISNTYPNYLWSPGADTVQAILVDSSGSYTVTIKDTNGCKSTSLPVIVTAVNCTGINEITQNKNEISIYPNPATTSLTIRQISPSVNQQLFIRNLLGEEIYHQPINNSQTTIDISKWSNGVYFYQIRNDKESLQGKFVVEK